VLITALFSRIFELRRRLSGVSALYDGSVRAELPYSSAMEIVMPWAETK
jgi:hypothetical protein